MSRPVNTNSDFFHFNLPNPIFSSLEQCAHDSLQSINATVREAVELCSDKINDGLSTLDLAVSKEFLRRKKLKTILVKLDHECAHMIKEQTINALCITELFRIMIIVYLKQKKYIH
ncbi:hypothetical protein ACFL6D_00490 [Spirochaetota bacterium]